MCTLASPQQLSRFCLSVLVELSVVTPDSINRLTTDALRERVALIASDASSNTPRTHEKLVPYMTYGLLSRLRSEVDALGKVQPLHLPKQCLVGLTLASVTGMKVPSRQDAEYIGNAVDYQLRPFLKEVGKAKDAARKRAAREVRAGKEPEVTCSIESRRSRINCMFADTGERLTRSQFSTGFPYHPQIYLSISSQCPTKSVRWMLCTVGKFAIYRYSPTRARIPPTGGKRGNSVRTEYKPPKALRTQSLRTYVRKNVRMKCTIVLLSYYCSIA